MSKLSIRLMLFGVLLGSFTVVAGELPGQWSADRAWAWHKQHPWLTGCNFLPSTAVNPMEMWQQETFDPKTINRELGFAEELGFNCMRVFLHYLAWEVDPEGLKKRLDEYLKISSTHKIKTMLVLFDDCWRQETKAGKQPEPLAGVHNSQWTQCPGPRMRKDVTNAWPKLERYVKDIVGAFGNDERVEIWDLYNEPGGAQHKGELCEAAFAWAREMKPVQPITSSIFQYPDNLETDMIQYAQSDIVSFHDYRVLKDVRKLVERLKKSGRPLLCTEYMARGNSTFSQQMAYFKQEGIGAINWGLVAGRMQTYRDWGTMNKPAYTNIRAGAEGGYDHPNWFHDILRDNGQPKYPFEAVMIKGLTGKTSFPKMLVPPANLQAVEWSCVQVKGVKAGVNPGPEGWTRPDFDDSGWTKGRAPFGIEFRGPATVWKTVELKHLLLRRTFEIPAGGARNPRLWILKIQSDADVYVNGVIAARLRAENPDDGAKGGRDYAEAPITPEAAATLKPGVNVLAVDFRERNWPLVDIGLVAE